MGKRKVASARETKQRGAGKKNESRRYFLILFVSGVLVGVIQLCFGVFFCAGCEMIAIAKNLVLQGSYGNPFQSLNTGATAANPPMYPLFLAVLIKVFKSLVPVAFAANLSNVVANAFTAAWLPSVSRLFYGNSWPGILGSILWLVSAPLIPAWDTTFTSAGLLLFCMYSASSLGTGKSLVSASLAGGIAGILFLLNPSSVLIFLPWIAYLIIRREATLRQTAVLLATLFLIGSIWAGRNYLQLGGFAVRTNLGMTLYASDNDCAEASLNDDLSNGCYQSHHPNGSVSEAQLLRTLGEVEFDRKRTADTELWIKTHQARFWRLTFERFSQFWLPPPYDEPFRTPAIWVTTVLFVPGLLLMIFRREPVTWFVLTVLLIYPLPYYVVVSDVRYRYPVLWLSLLPAGYFIRQGYSYFSARRMSRNSLHK